MPSALDNLAGPGGPLRHEAFDAREYEGLVHSALVRLADARRSDLSLESRFDLAYNAAHAFCLAALRREGYRASHRYVVFQVLPHTLGLGPEVWRVLDRSHRIRNQGEYEGVLDVDDRLVTDLLAACERVRSAVDALSAL